MMLNDDNDDDDNDDDNYDDDDNDNDDDDGDDENTTNEVQSDRFWQPDRLFLWFVVQYSFVTVTNYLTQAPAEFSENL